jgi:hypothetical protein
VVVGCWNYFVYCVQKTFKINIMPRQQVPYTSFVIDRLDSEPNNTRLAELVQLEFSLDMPLDSIRRIISGIRSRNAGYSNKPIKRLFYDIETSYAKGWFWRPSYNTRITYQQIIEHSKIICISYKWQGEDKVHNLKWNKDQCDKEMVYEFIKVMNKADEIVAHNGDKFDEKWIRKRAIYHRLPMRPKYQSLDTLKKARTHFGFDSNRLDDLGDYLGVGRKLENEKGLWDKVVQFNNRKALQKMVDYCDVDVILLEDVFTVMMPYIRKNTNFAVLKGGEKFHCNECASPHTHLAGTYTTAAGTFKRIMECKSCNNNFKINNSTYQKYLQQKMIDG